MKSGLLLQSGLSHISLKVILLIFSPAQISAQQAWDIHGHQSLLISEAGSLNSDADTLRVGMFSQENPDVRPLPHSWEPMEFRGLRPSSYKLEKLDGMTVVRAESQAASSGLYREVDIDLNAYPILEWSWKVDKYLENSDITRKDGDDYPARIYVMFDYPLSKLPWTQRTLVRLLRTFYGQVPTRAINYIYGGHEDPGTIGPNPYSDLVTMIVVDSGIDSLGKWKSFQRNVYKDYIQLFGEEPGRIAGIAIMTDSDDTKGQTLSWFGDIFFLSEN